MNKLFYIILIMKYSAIIILVLIGIMIISIILYRMNKKESYVYSKKNIQSETLQSVYYMTPNSDISSGSVLLNVDASNPSQILFTSTGSLECVSIKCRLPCRYCIQTSPALWTIDTSGNNSLVFDVNNNVISIIRDYGQNNAQVLISSPKVVDENSYFLCNRFGGLALYDQSFNLTYPYVLEIGVEKYGNQILPSFFQKCIAIAQNASLQIIDATRNNLLLWNYGPVDYKDPPYFKLTNSGISVYSKGGTEVFSCLNQQLDVQPYIATLSDSGILTIFDENSTPLWNNTIIGSCIYNSYNPKIKCQDNKSMIDGSACQLNTFDYLLSPDGEYQLILQQYFDVCANYLSALIPYQSPTAVALELRQTSNNTVIWQRKSPPFIDISFYRYYKLTFTPDGDICVIDPCFNICTTGVTMGANTCMWRFSGEDSTFIPTTNAFSFSLTNDPALEVCDLTGKSIYKLSLIPSPPPPIGNNRLWNKNTNKDKTPVTLYNNQSLISSKGYYTLDLSNSKLQVTDVSTSKVTWSYGYGFSDSSDTYMEFANSDDCGGLGDVYIGCSGSGCGWDSINQWGLSQCKNYTLDPSAAYLQINDDGTFGVYDISNNTIWDSSGNTCSNNTCSL